MAHINLLPWREELRKQKTTEFAMLAGFVAVLSFLIVAGARFHMGTLVDFQESRNQYLQSELDILKIKLEKIKDLKKTKEALLARMNVIQELQRSRPQIVHTFEDIVKTIPDGVWLTKIVQKGTSITATGKAESNARVSAYMRNIEASPWLKDPSPEIIQAEKNERISAFTMHLKQESPDASSEEPE